MRKKEENKQKKKEFKTDICEKNHKTWVEPCSRARLVLGQQVTCLTTLLPS
jgi:hypothetical protein